MKHVILASVIATLMAGGAYAADTAGGKHHGGMMKKIDTNGDGVVTREESRAFSDKKFDMIDTNKDGKIDQTERDAHHEQMKAKRAEWKAKKAAEVNKAAPAAKE